MDRFPALCLLVLVLAGAHAAQAAPQATPPGDAREEGVALLRERLAHHVGTIGYLWGYPIVDLSTQMHNETHRVREGQPVLAPPNRFHRREHLVTPATAAHLRAPNNDTLYLSGWFDLAAGPVIIETPDTAGRYYTLAVTDFFNEVTHLGRRTTGTAARVFALTGPGFDGTLPEGVTAVPVATSRAWVLGRLLVEGEADLPAALALLRAFHAEPLAGWRPGRRSPAPEPEAAAPMDPRGTLEYFAVLNRWLRANRARPGEEALIAQFDQAGFGPAVDFDAAALDAATRRGLEAAIADARAMIAATGNAPMKDVRNGWIFPLGLADYGFDYLLRASVAAGGYANRPEESTYAARTVDDAGQLLDGSRRYRLRFAREQLPPAAAFWSLAAYDLRTRALFENPIKRYSIGDRTPGLAWNADGSLEIELAQAPPAGGTGNWLPVGAGPFMLVLRIYEPRPAVFDGSYRPPVLEVVD